MKKLVFRHFILDVFKFFIISIFIMGLIVWVIQAINYFDFVSHDGHGLKVYFSYAILNFPKIIHRILPFMFFISLFYTIIRYENNNELSLFWINGISKIKFINIIIIFSLFLMIFQVILGSYISPLAQLKARNLIKNSDIAFFTNLLKEGKFINAVKGLTIFIDEKNSQNFKKIFIDDSSLGYSRLIYAKDGMLVSNKKNKKFILYNGKVINIKENRVNIFEFEEINFDLRKFRSNSIVDPKIQEINSKNLIECVFNIKFNDNRKCRNKNEIFNDTKQELLKRFFKPIYIPLIALLCCFLLISGKKNLNFRKVIKNIFLIIFVLIIISEASLRYSTTSNFSFLAYLLTPLILFLIFYTFSYYKINNA